MSRSNRKFLKTSQVLGPLGQVQVMSQVSEIQAGLLSGLLISDSQYFFKTTVTQKLHLMQICDIMAELVT